MITIGKNTYVSPKAQIIGHTTETPYIKIGDNCYIGDDVQIICDRFEMGDYGKLQHHVNIHGSKVIFGHNVWVGQYTVVDGLGGTYIGNNFAIGPHSFMFSHVKFGDTLEGCRYDSLSSLFIGNDVWLAGGNTTVYPVRIADKAMSLAGAVITNDLYSNRVYGGVPAKDLTDKIKPQFVEVSIELKYKKMAQYLLDSGINSRHLHICHTSDEFKNDGQTYFEVDKRTYTKRNTDEEIAFMKYLLPSKAKFTPYSEDISLWTELEPLNDSL